MFHCISASNPSSVMYPSQLLHGEHDWELLIAAAVLDHLRILKDLCTPGDDLKPTKKNTINQIKHNKEKKTIKMV